MDTFIKQVMLEDRAVRLGLEKARKVLDKTTLPGKKLDKMLTKLYLSIGYLDDRHDLNMSRLNYKKFDEPVAQQFFAFFKGDVDSVLNKLGVDTQYYHSINSAIAHKLGLDRLYRYAVGAIENFKFNVKRGEGWDWDHFKSAENIVNFYKALEEYRYTVANTTNEDIISKLILSEIYKKPSNYMKIIENFAKESDYDISVLIHNLEKHINHPLPNYILELQEEKSSVIEGLVDYSKDKLARVANAAAAKYGFGGVKDAANARQYNRNRMNDLFKNWSKVATAGKLPNDPSQLKQFLLVQGVPADVIQKVLKEFKPKFVNNKPRLAQKPANPKYVNNYPRPSVNVNVGNQNQAPKLGPQMTSAIGQQGSDAMDNLLLSRDNPGNPLTEAMILPNDELRNLFLRTAELEVVHDLQTKSNNITNKTPAATAAPASTKVTKNKTTSAPASTSAAPVAGTASAAPALPKTVDDQDIQNYLNKMSPQQRADYIKNNILANLPQDQIKTLVQSLFTNKK